jgi:hypothetical protein
MRISKLTLVLLLLAGMIFGPIHASYAASVSITLTRTTAVLSAPDVAGTTFHDGGTITFGTTTIGRFIRTIRTVTGITEPQNTGVVTINLIALGTAPSLSVTLVGTHDFSSANELGGIGASSITGLTGFTWSATTGGGPGTVYTLTLNLP